LKGYLLKEHTFNAGEDTFIESVSSENNYGVVFEDDKETGYFYALEFEAGTRNQRILDALHIYTIENVSDKHKPSALKIIWSKDWLKCALIINNYCHAVFDFENQGGYNRDEFPPPNAIWTKGSRKLTDEMITTLFK
jgi:hypothetical protein